MTEVSQKIKEAIERTGISQSYLARRMGISRQHLHDILKSNRKSKYLSDIAKVLHISKFDSALFEGEFSTDENLLPILTMEDVQEVLGNISHLAKPFFKKWPFYEPSGTESHFCLRLPQEFAYNLNSYALATFRFYLPLEIKSGSIVMAYIGTLKKVFLGRLEVNTETGARFLVSEARIDPIEKGSWIVAECTQFVNLFES